MEKEVNRLMVLLLLFPARSQASDPLLDNSISEYSDTVVTASKVKQTRHEAPSAMTVIESETFESLGIVKLEDIFRYVAGFQVIKGFNGPKVTYHGTNANRTRRNLVLVDGIRIHTASDGVVDWNAMPFDITRVDRVEVARSPLAVLYGTHAGQATINIILKKPSRDKSGFLVRTGSNDTRHARLKHVITNDEKEFVIELGHRQDDGYDQDFIPDDLANGDPAFGDDITNVQNGWETAHDSHELVYINSSLKIELKNTTLDIDTKISDLDYTSRPELFFREYADDPFPIVYTENQNSFFTLKGETRFSQNHTSKYHLNVNFNKSTEESTNCRFANSFYWEEEARLFEFGPSIWTRAIELGIEDRSELTPEQLIAYEAYEARINSSFPEGRRRDYCSYYREPTYERSFDLNYEHAYQVTEKFRLISGIGGTSVSTESEALYGNREINETQFRSFLHAEFQLTNKLYVNLGAMYEHFDLVDAEEFSPRVALNYFISNNHTIKIIGAQSTVIPPFLTRESELNRTVRLTDRRTGELINDNNVYAFTNQANPDAGPEEIESIELVYYAKLPKLGLEYDIKLFNEKLENLLSTLGDATLWSGLNDGEVELTGIESQLRYDFSNNTKIGVTYAYIDNESNTRLEESLYSQNTGSMYISKSINNAWNMAFSINYNNIANTEYREYTINLSKKFNQFRSFSPKIALLLQYYDNKEQFKMATTNTEDISDFRLIHSRFEDKLHAVLTISFDY